MSIIDKYSNLIMIRNHAYSVLSGSQYFASFSGTDKKAISKLIAAIDQKFLSNVEELTAEIEAKPSLELKNKEIVSQENSLKQNFIKHGETKLEEEKVADKKTKKNKQEKSEEVKQEAKAEIKEEKTKETKAEVKEEKTKEAKQEAKTKDLPSFRRV